MKKILVPTDFSEQANYAVDVALQLAKKNNSELILLNVVEYPASTSFTAMGGGTYDPMDNVFFIQLMEKVKTQFNSIINEDRFEGIKISYEVKIGNPYTNIADAVIKHHVDLIVMGSKGTSGLEELLIGSNTEKVVRNAKCPVLTIKSKLDIGNIRKIVFATDLDDDQSTILEELNKLQKTLKAELYILRVNTPNNFETDRILKRRMNDFVKRTNLQNSHLHIVNDLIEEDGIIYFAEENNIDMIALATHGRSGFMHLLSGSIAEDVVNHAKRPVWTYRIKKSDKEK